MYRLPMSAFNTVMHSPFLVVALQRLQVICGLGEPFFFFFLRKIALEIPIYLKVEQVFHTVESQSCLRLTYKYTKKETPSEKAIV